MLGRFLPTYCLRELYFAYFHSHILYCLLIWFPVLMQSNQNALSTLQKKILRNVCNAQIQQHCMPLFKRNKILRIQDQCCLEGIKLVFRLHHDLCPSPIVNLYDPILNLHKTRGIKYKAIKHKSVKVNNSFLCKPLCDW